MVVKRLLPQHALDPQLLRMFLDEARLLARLAHPNIPQVFDVGDQPQLQAPYFVMELIDGPDLRDILTATTDAAAGVEARSTFGVPLAEALGIVSGAAAGLHHAHEARGEDGRPLGIVHRDVSPSNVVVSMDGAVKITDFGIAKWANQRSRTEHGQLKGKFAYMSPEQCRGEPLDRRSDVFALGSLLYELTTGRPAFTAQSDFELLSTIVSRPPRPPTWPGETAYPPALAAIVMRALEQKPEDRFPTAQALQLALEDFARQAGLTLSAVTLSAWLRRLFADRPHSFWPESREPEVSASATKAPRTRTLTDVAPLGRTDGEGASRAQATARGRRATATPHGHGGSPTGPGAAQARGADRRRRRGAGAGPGGGNGGPALAAR